jgi:putative SOS response-associated peptidase YedK
MCGRYSNQTEWSELRISFDAGALEPVGADPLWRPRFNISPNPGAGGEVPIVRRASQGARALRRELALARFWFIPTWWQKPLDELPTAFNARLEGLASRPLFRDALRTSRCLVPATGWREFVGARLPKQPFCFRPAALSPGEPFAFAGLCSRWLDRDGRGVESFAIVTVPPSAPAATIHSRMPLVLPRELYEAWLEDDQAAPAIAEEAARSCLALALEIYPSDPIANDIRYEGPRALARAPSPDLVSAAQEGPEQLGLFGSGPADTAPTAQRRRAPPRRR